MTYLSEKLEKFVEYVKKNGYGVKDNSGKVIVIPSENYYTEYQMVNPNVENLTEEERKFLKVKCQNIIFDLVVKGIVPQSAIKTLLAYYCNMSEKVKKKEDVEKPQVVFQMAGMEDVKPFETPDNISFENEAVKKVEEELKNEGNI